MDEEVTKRIWTLKFELNPNLIMVKYRFSAQKPDFHRAWTSFSRPQLNLGFMAQPNRSAYIEPGFRFATAK